ncbi:glycosyltransferase [Raineyella sp.]|uniref:glycosyltransferase n=1 Tax=Raineyella sp. TaxID=1911550 RepID=UPI002B20FF58|nr:glycosyltransferase [Raineyella sp.]MEA5153901.1 glycosyltransferase [Raineyella sp.]
MRVLRVFHSAVVDAWRERERALARAGVEVTTLTARRWDEGGQVVELRARPDEQVRAAATIGRHPALFLYDPRPIWRALGEDWDILDLHEEPFALATAEILLLRALRGRRMPYALYSAQNIRKRYPIPFRHLERHALRHAAGLQTCNADAARICQDKGFPGAARVIPLGLDPDHFTPGSTSGGLPTGHAVPTGHAAPTGDGAADVVVGYVGRLAPHKGIDVLLEAVAGEPRLRLRIAGAGPEAETLRLRVAAGGLRDRVEFVGPVDQAELPTLYRGLDVLAVPSLTTASWVEQYGRVAVEAMACGTPVVASDTGALPEVVGGAGLLVAPGDPVALRAALVRVGSDPQLAADLRARGLGRAAATSWERVAEDFLALYRSMLHRPADRDGQDGDARRVDEPHVDEPHGPDQTRGPNERRGVEVVLVAYRSADLVRRALTPIAGALPVTVVDNSSLPEIRQLCAELGCHYVDAGHNGGFAAGVNLALRHRQLPDADVLLLNPDAVVSVEDIDTLHTALLTDPDLASVGPSQVDGAGRPARVSWPFPSPRGSWLEALGLGRWAGPDRYVIGSVLLLRAEALAQVGSFDERFFLYAEETDWAYRAHLLGWHHAEVTTVTVEHLGAATSTDPSQRDAHFFASQERYLRKHFGAPGWQAARVGQVLGAGLRAVVLPGGRGRAAAARARTFVRGPIRAEATTGRGA